MSENIPKESIAIRSSAKSSDKFFLKFLFYFFKIFGILTISYDFVWKNDTKSRSLVFKFSRIGIVYNIILTTFLIVLDGYNFFVLKPKVNYMVETKQEILLNDIGALLRVLGTVFILIIFSFKHSKMVSIANKINLVRSLSEKPVITEKKLFGFYVGNFIAVFLILFTINYYIYKVVTIHLIRIFIVSSLLVQYTFVLKMIKDFYKFINDSLQELLLKRSCWNLDDIKLGLKIDKLMYMYSCLCNLSQELSDFYSLPMIFATFHLYLYLLSRSYYYIKSAFISGSYLKNWKIFFDVYLVTLSLTILVVNVTNTIKEVNILVVIFCHSNCNFFLSTEQKN